VIAAGIFAYYHGVAIYYYGASTSDIEMRKHMAPYLLQWEAMREGKSRGCHTYDFLGIAVPGDETSHLAGVSSFKEKFG
jgi:lipid II:glycine glycyltransferase (peptidoglycan interpeptide bridge formation enzyme)